MCILDANQKNVFSLPLLASNRFVIVRPTNLFFYSRTRGKCGKNPSFSRAATRVGHFETSTIIGRTITKRFVERKRGGGA